MTVAADGYWMLLNCGIKSTAFKKCAEEKQSALNGLLEKKDKFTDKKGRVISCCFDIILATVILCYTVKVYCKYQKTFEKAFLQLIYRSIYISASKWILLEIKKYCSGFIV